MRPMPICRTSARPGQPSLPGIYHAGKSTQLRGGRWFANALQPWSPCPPILPQPSSIFLRPNSTSLSLSLRLHSNRRSVPCSVYATGRTFVPEARRGTSYDDPSQSPSPLDPTNYHMPQTASHSSAPPRSSSSPVTLSQPPTKKRRVEGGTAQACRPSNRPDPLLACLNCRQKKVKVHPCVPANQHSC